MADYLSGILGAALNYDTPLPFQPELVVQRVSENIQSCDFAIQNESLLSTETLSTTQMQNVQLLNEFDAYNITAVNTEQYPNEETGESSQNTTEQCNAFVTPSQKEAAVGTGVLHVSESNLSIESEVKEINNPLKNLLQIQVKENKRVKRRRRKKRSNTNLESSNSEKQSTESTERILPYGFDIINETKTSTFEDRDLTLEDSFSSFGTVSSTSSLPDLSSVSSTTSAASPIAPSVTEPVKRKRTRRREVNPDKTPPPQILPPCKICDDKSSGFHYGANTCEACKGFFRRTLKKKEVTFQCRCIEEEKATWARGPSKNGCPACRYERCLAVGMSKNAIKIGRYTLDRKTENIKEVKTLEAMDTLINNAITEATLATSPDSQTITPIAELYINSSESQSGPLSPLSALVQSALTEEQPPMKKTKSVCDDEDSSLSADACTESSISLKEIDTIVKTIVDAQNNHAFLEAKQFNKECIKERQTRCLERYAMKTSLFGKMSLPSIAEFREFYEATGLDLNGHLEDTQKALQFFESRLSKLVLFAKSIPGFTTLNIDDQASLIKASRVESVFIAGYELLLTGLDMDKQVIITPWGKEYHLNEIEGMCPKGLLVWRYKLARELKEMDLTAEERAVMRGISIMATDRCNLKEPEKADRLQSKLFTCLQHLLSVRPGGPGTKFFKIFNFIIKLRDFTHNRVKRAKSIYLDWPALFSNFHLISEFMR